MDSRVLAGVLRQVAASLPETPTARSDALQPKLAQLFTLIESAVEESPVIRNLVAGGIATFTSSQFMLEGKVIQTAVFAASLKRYGLLWKLLLKELEALSCPQRLLLKLQYCQKFCIQTFNTSPLDTKRSMVSDNAASLSIALELSVAIIQGFLPTELNQMAATMISFFQLFQRYIPCDITPLHPSHCQNMLAKLIVISEPNKQQETALELVMTAVLHSVSYYGWHATIGDVNIETLLMVAVHSQSEKLSITSKALLAFMPGTLGAEVLLDREQLCLIVRQLSIATATSEPRSNKYGVREILTITKAVTRVSDNCSGLLDQGLEETLDALMEQGDETANAVVAEITWKIAAASGGADVEEEPMERSSTESDLDSKWGYAFPQANDPDGTIVLTDILLHHLAQLVFEKSPSDLSAEEAMTMETMVFTVFDIYWQSEAKMKSAISKLFGDKYIKCLIDLNQNLHFSFALKADIVADLGYSMLIQDMARKSAYFCQKCGTHGLIGVLLCTVPGYMDNLVAKVNQTMLDYRLMVLFYCAHIKAFHYSTFGIMSAINTLTCVLESPAARTRLLTRLIICCLHPIMEDHHMTLLQITDEESQLLLTYIKDTKLPGGLDRAKFLKAVSVLYREFCPQNALGPVAGIIAETAVEQILQECDNRVLEGALCLLWTLSRTSGIAQTISQISHLVPALRQMQQTSIPAISSLAKSVLWQLGYGNYEDHAERYDCAHTCLRYGFYTECIDHCDHIIAATTSSLHGVARQVRGKAYAHLHQNQFWHVMKEAKLDVAVPWKGGDFVDQCATKAKIAVQDLGFALDHGVLDEEGSYLMDVAMLHFVRIKHQLRDCNRCLLCRRRGMKLKESHTCPRFLLKESSKTTKKGLQQLGIADEVDSSLFHSIGGRFAAYTPNTITYAILCGRCEQCLSQNGESQFRKDILPLIHNETDEIQTVKYTDSIYSFCLGIVFRSFVHNAFTAYSNAHEIHSLFIACRHHLLSLPVNYSETEIVLDPPSVPEVKSLTPTEAFLFVSPYKIHIENSQLILLSASMTTNFGVWYLTTPLSTEPKAKANFCHALVARLTCCSVIVPFSPSQGGSLDTRFRINPSGGEYHVLPDISRWKTIPSGLLQVFVSFAIIFAKQYQQVLSGMKTTKKDSKKADTFIDSLISLPKIIGFSEQPITASSLQSIPPKEAELITTFLSKSLLVVKMLPEGFDFCDPPPKVILKEGYVLLYHIHDEQQGATFFFAANLEGIAFGKLIVIMKFTEENEKFERVEGFNVHIREDGSSCSICVTENLLVPATEKLQETQRLRHETVSERIKKAVNSLLRRCGSLRVLLDHARLQMRLKDNPCLDHRCSSTGCWYCKDRCHICMDLANQGYTLFPSKGLMFKHCSEECKAIVEDVPHFSVDIHPALPLKLRSMKAVVLASIKGCLATVMSTHTIVQVSICISMERTSIAYARPFAIVQLRTQEQHTFFSVYLADDFSPIEPVNSFPPAFSFQMLKDSDILAQVFKVSLTPLEVFNISQLLGSGGATGVESTLAKVFSLSCSSCTRKLPWENILVSLESKISREELVSKWIVEQVILACDDENNLLQLQSSEVLSQESILLPSANACTTMFWAYLQLTCSLWKRILDECSLSVEKLMYTTLITVKLYEQSPSDVQSCIISTFCSSAHILLLCGKLSVVAIKGGLPLNLHQSVVQILLFAHKLIATVNNASGMESIFARHLFQDLEGINQDDVQKTSKVSAVAQHWLLTLTLKSLSFNVTSVEAVPNLLNSIQTFLESPFLGIALMANAIAVTLLQHSPHDQVGLTVSDIGVTDKEVDFLAEIIHDFCQDDLKRKYYLYCVLQVLSLLCSQPINASRFASHNILSELETLMECAGEHEDIIANVLWKIATGSGGENSTEVTDKTLSGEETSDSEVDISLEVEQGLCYTVDKLLMIIHEFCNMYLECKHIPESHGCTVSSVAQLLCGLHQVMERREKEEVAESVSRHTAILTVLGSAVSKHRESWLCIHNGICGRSAIESLLITWTGCSKAISQAVVGVGVLTAITNSLHWALDCAPALTASDIEGLRNQVLIIYNVARRCPKQTAYQLQLSTLQPLLHCSSLPVRVLSKSIVAFIANYRDISEIKRLSLEKDEVKFFADGFGGFVQSGSASICGLHFSGEELLYSLKCVTSLPSDKTCFAVPDVLDTVLTLCLRDDKTIAKLALEVLWNISMEPTVALAILCHESVVDTLKRMSVFTCGLAHLPRNILWILGYGDITDTTECSEYAFACYQHRKYTEAVTWCNHVVNMLGAAHHELSAVKSCKGKALAQIYLHRQNQQLQRSDQWAMLGYDSNSVITELSIVQNFSLYPTVSSKNILNQLCLADLENWKNLCSQGRQAIQILGELLDSDELDEEGSELLDWVMMDYYRETGETNDCNRCLLCRGTGELVFVAPKPAASEAENPTSDHNILSLQSFVYIEGSQRIFMFCKECEVLLSHHSGQNLEFLIKATQKLPTTYGREVYLELIAKVARALPMVYTGTFRDVYNTFVACRQILLSHDTYTSTIAFPKIHLFNNPKAVFLFNRQSCELHQFLQDGNAVIAIKHTVDKEGDPQKIQFLVMSTEEWNLVVDIGSGKAENDALTSQSLIHADGGSFRIPSVNEQWESFPPELLQAFYDLKLADEKRGVLQYIMNSEGKDLSAQPSPRLFSKSARFWLPQKHFISFLPEGFSMEVDSDAIRNISLPDGHKILRHHHDHEKDLTVFLAYATDTMFQEKQFYFIFTCRLCSYIIADAIFLNGDAKELLPFSNAILFEMTSSLAIGEVNMVRQLLMQKYSPISCVLKSLMSIIITKYGDIGVSLKGVATYEDVTKNCNLAVSVDTRCSPEGCWYCQYRCHSCLKPAAIGYTWRDSNTRKLLRHCSERCHYMYTADIPDSTLLHVKIGEIQTQSGNGAHLLISATVLLNTGLSKNNLVITQVAVSYGCKEIPSGVVYAHTQMCTTEYRTPLLAFFVQHDLSPAKYVWDVTEFQTADLADMWREMALIRKSLQPVLEMYGCDDLPSFLEKHFPFLDVSFMNANGTIYSWPPISGQDGQVETSEDGLMGKKGDGDPTAKY